MATKKNANVIRIDKLYPYSKNSLIHFREKQVAKKKKEDCDINARQKNDVHIVEKVME